jgi:ring-1,2-phenylacetyl-CoA epoxidase subunit PaaE
LLEAESSFTLIYGNRSSRSVMFKETLCDLKNRYPQRLHRFICSAKRVSIARCWAAASTANISAASVNLYSISVFDHAFICGPESMMDDAQTCWNRLREWRPSVFTANASIPAGVNVRPANVSERERHSE